MSVLWKVSKLVSYLAVKVKVSSNLSNLAYYLLLFNLIYLKSSDSAHKFIKNT